MTSNNRKRRRESPSYEDYPVNVEQDHEPSGERRYVKPRLLANRRSPSSRRFDSDEEGLPLRFPRSMSPQQESSTTNPPSSLFRHLNPSTSHRLKPSFLQQAVEPTDDYLLMSREPSRRQDDSTRSRKLVVLDLNGSLLLRSQHRLGRGIQPRFRAVHLRPYLPVFTSYLFHDETKRWLDVMVWSSAQPHSVQDMVHKCFQNKADNLIAVWARDTLGLDDNEYYRKTQTLKDLEKPWVEFATRHSGQTTMLIDDSPLKAALQPWNHLCIKEYVAEMRALDIRVASWEKARRRLHEARETLERNKELKRKEDEESERVAQEGDKFMNDAIQNPGNKKVIMETTMVNGKIVGRERVMKRVEHEILLKDGEPVGNSGDESTQVESNKKPSAKNRKKKLKHLARIVEREEELAREAAMAAEDAEMEEGEIDTVELEREHKSEDARLEAVAFEMKYDETLLAVIGVLDHIKNESNVAGWMRHGGLLKIEVAEAASRLGDNPDGPPSKKRKKLDSSNGKGRIPSPTPLLPSSSEKNRLSPSREGDTPPVSPTTTSPPPPPSSQGIGEEETARVIDPLPLPSLWFQQPDVLAYWADRGRRALQALGIPVESDIVIPG